MDAYVDVPKLQTTLRSLNASEKASRQHSAFCDLNILVVNLIMFCLS